MEHFVAGGADAGGSSSTVVAFLRFDAPAEQDGLWNSRLTR